MTPVLASLLLPLHIAETETIVVRMLRSIYSPVLRWSLANRKVMLAIGLAFLAATGLLWTRLGSEFLPALEEGNYWDPRLAEQQHPPRYLGAVSQGNASMIWRASHSAVGFSVTANHNSCRHRWPRTRNANSC